VLGAIPEPRHFDNQWQWEGLRVYRVKLENVRGRVLLRRWEQTGVLIQATLRATQAVGAEELRLFRTAEFKAQEMAAGLVSVRPAFPGLSSEHPAVVAAATPHLEMDWRVTVPASAVLEVRQEVGNIVGHGLAGRLDLFTRDGDIALSASHGWLEAANERGTIVLRDVVGDAELRSVRGRIESHGQLGDLRALNAQGDVVLEVAPRWVGEVSFRTVSGNIYSDMATRHTDMEPGDRGYEGILQGPLATNEASPAWRVRVDTLQGNLTVAPPRRGLAPTGR
jgi:hypothetical protein